MDRLLTRLPPLGVWGIAAFALVLVALLDVATGYEISLSLIYLGPVALAAWYTGRRGAVAIALFAAIAWLLADTASGVSYSHPLITFWQLLVRLGVFLIQALLLVALRDALARERVLARTDPLTGLSTRRAFEEQIQHDLRLARRRHSPISLAFIDLDDFKEVNDSRGHLEGDQVLRITGRVLRNSTRVADTVARFGGDEFVWALPDTGPRGAEEAVLKILEDLRRALASETWKVTFSTGVITFLDTPAGIDEALQAADRLMYEAKRQGKDTALFQIVGQHPARRDDRPAARYRVAR